MERSSGILMPMSSLSSNYGIGTMGKSAYDFVDFLASSGQSYWQLLPLGPTSYGDSPYTSFSSFAGNPYFIDLDMLIEEGLLESCEVETVDWGSDPQQVDYGRIYENRFKVLKLAFERVDDSLAQEIEQFRRDSGMWLENYSMYMALKAHFGMKSWTEWPDRALRRRDSEKLLDYGCKLAQSRDFYVFLQFMFFRQWDALRKYANEKGVQFIGDIPIYVALDSADVWSEPQFFQLDDENRPTQVSGVPPDAFTEDGQLWGNPVYDWEMMKSDGYGWWIRRIDGARKLYDVVRIDHFRGFDSYWSVPAGETTAKNGVWEPGPGMELVGVLKSWFNDIRFIAEDLGYLTPAVKKLVADSGFPSMRVLQFAFDAHGESGYLPHRCTENTVCYIGTHDNDTITGWLKTTSEEDKRFAATYMHITPDEGWHWGFIRSGMATSSELFVVQMQDILMLPQSCRMNTPGTSCGNWCWRMASGATDRSLSEKLLNYTQTFRRTKAAVMDMVAMELEDN